MADKDLQHVQHIRGSETASDAYTGLEGELTINRTSQSVRVHDGVTEGGHGTIYHARVNEIPNENDIPKDWAVGCRVIAGAGTVAGAGVVPLPELTDERVVATLNGKKVYEKTVFMTTGDAVNVETERLTIDLSVDLVVSLVGTVKNVFGAYATIDHAEIDTNVYVVYNTISKTFFEKHNYNSYSSMPVVITLRYTKTTD